MRAVANASLNQSDRRQMGQTSEEKPEPKKEAHLPNVETEN
jgi:hypothetical protein